MIETPPTKPPLPPLRERLKLSNRFVDVTDQHKGEVFVLATVRMMARLAVGLLKRFVV